MALIKTQNAEGGSDARYDVSQMTPEERLNFDSEGRPLGSDNPDQWVWTPGLPGARGGNDNSHMGQPGGGSGGTVGGSANPYFQQTQSILNAQGSADAADTRAAIQQALVSFGLVPEGFQDKMGALDDLTRDLIAKNTKSGISTHARLLEGRADHIRDLVNRLTSKGLRRSGARGYGLRRGQLDFDRIFQDALAQLQGHTGGLYKNYANNEYNRQLQLANALSNAFVNFRPSSPSSPSNPSTTTTSQPQSQFTAPDFFAPLANASPALLAGSLRFGGGGGSGSVRAQ